MKTITPMLLSLVLAVVACGDSAGILPDTGNPLPDAGIQSAGNQPDSGVNDNDASESDDPSLSFTADDEIRADGWGPMVQRDSQTGTFYLYYNRGGGEDQIKYYKTSTDGLNFSEEKVYVDNEVYSVDGRLMPEMENGQTVYRRYLYQPNVKGFKSYVSTDNIKFTEEEGVAFDPPGESPLGIAHSFASSSLVGIVYIDGLDTDESRVKLALSTDNGRTFALADENPLQDDNGATEGPQVDPFPYVLPDGRVRVLTMHEGTKTPTPGKYKAGTVNTSTSTDGGKTFTKDEGARLLVDDLGAHDAWTINDPVMIALDDGRYRIFFAAIVKNPDAAPDADMMGKYHFQILSATSK
jgi:hypothetical protein